MNWLKNIFSKRKLEATLRLLVVVVISFLALFYLTLIFSISASPFLIGFLLIYTISPPFLANIRHAATYFVLLPVPCLGSWLLSIVYLSSFAAPLLQASVLVSAIPVTLTTLVHVFSRSRYFIGRISMVSFSRYSIAAASAIFFMVGLLILGSTPTELNTLNKAIFYSSLLLAYIMSSMLYVNSAYRYRKMCENFGTNKIEKEMSTVWEKIGNRYSGKEKDVDLLRHYFTDAWRLFEEGAYEKAFISAYKVINEETVVNPKEYVSDKREGEPSSFSDIRTILLHSRRKKVQINVKKIRKTKRKLPQYSIELLKKCYAFLKKLV